MVWIPSDPTRFAMLGLADSDPNGELAADASTGDLLAHGLVPRGALDPVDGIIEGVCAELEVLSIVHESPVADTLEMLSRRLDVAISLLRRADGRERIPEVEPSPKDEPEGGVPAEPVADTTTTPATEAAPTMSEEGAPVAPRESSDHVLDRLPRRGEWRMPFKPANPARCAMLELAAPLPTNKLPPDATTADVLLRGLTLFGAGDPVEGILESVRAGLGVVRMKLDESPLSDVLEMIDRRIFVTIALLRLTDERERIPEVGPSPEDEPEDEAPAAPEADATTTPATEAAPTMPEEGAPVAPLEVSDHVPERLPRRGGWRMPFKPANPARRAMLGLADPAPTNDLPPNATTADVLLVGVVPDGVEDPVDGMLESIRLELRVVRMALGEEDPVYPLLEMIDRRICISLVLLRRTDGREPIPEVEGSEDEEPKDGAPAEPVADATMTPAALPAPTVPEGGAPAAPLDAGSSTPRPAAPPAPADTAPPVAEGGAPTPIDVKPKP